jgi:putative phosphoesterase
MRLGVLSDTHDNIGNLLKALRFFEQAEVSTLLHCGDMTGVTAAQQMAGFTVLYVNGNMDDSAETVKDALGRLNPANETPGLVFTGKLDGVPIAATHGHVSDRLETLVRSGKYRFVFHGHTHRRRDEVAGRVRVINPGALGGVRYEPRTVCIVDLESQEVTFHEVAEW